MPPGYRPSASAQEARSLLLRISFTSKVAIPDSGSYYNAVLSYARSPSCRDHASELPSDYDIRAGQRVVFDELIPYSCPGVIHGTVNYIATTGAASSMPIFGLAGQTHATAVGRFSFAMP
jgi:hypothetical protein